MSRVAFVVTGGFDPSGRERVIPALLSLVERVASRHDVTVYVLRYFDCPRRYALAGADVQDLGRPTGLRRQYSALLEAMRRDGPFDVVHAYWALPAGVAGAAVGRRLGIPAIVTLDSGEFVAIPEIGYGAQQQWRQRLAVAATCRLAARLTVCSRYQERLAREHGVSADVVPLGVNTSVFVPAPRSEGPPWRLLHVASLNPVKDQPTLVEGLRRLISRIPEVHLDVVGEDTLNGAIQALANRAGVARHITFHGFQPSETLVTLYQQAHLSVITSRHEAAAVVALEAAACGTPTVGSHVGYLADWAPHAAITVPPGDPEALADAMARALGDRAVRERVAAAARDWTLAHDADWTAAQFDRLYQDLPARRTASR